VPLIFCLYPPTHTMDFRFQISDFRFQISDFRFQISDFRFQISISDFDFRFRGFSHTLTDFGGSPPILIRPYDHVMLDGQSGVGIKNPLHHT
jgi:hypothetical protein